jgi:hypothetical protein
VTRRVFLRLAASALGGLWLHHKPGHERGRRTTTTTSTTTTVTTLPTTTTTLVAGLAYAAVYADTY